MITTKIEISGMGSVINFEAIVIERLFKELGYNVEVNNPNPFIEHHPHPSMISETEDQYIERVKKLHCNGDYKVEINVIHHPWGG